MYGEEVVIVAADKLPGNGSYDLVIFIGRSDFNALHIIIVKL